MKKRKGFHRLRPVIRSALSVVVIAIGLVLAGCGEETARIGEQQVQLQVMAKTNAQHIKALAGVIEQNHQKLMSGIEAVQKEIDGLDARALAVGEEHVKLQKVQVKLQEAVQSNTRLLTTKLTAIEQNQNDLLTGMEAVQNDAKQVAVDLTSVADEQAKLYQTVQSNSQQLVDTSTAIEQNRQEWQTTMGGLQENIEQVASNMNTLSSDLLKLQDILQGNIRELVSMMDASNAGQLEFQEKTRAGLQALDASLSSVKESQSTLQSQIDDVQRSTEALGREIPTAIEQLTDEISNIKMSETNEYTETEETFVSPDSGDI